MRLKMDGTYREVNDFHAYLLSMERMSLLKVVSSDLLQRVSDDKFFRFVSVKILSGIGSVNSLLKK